MNALDLFPEVRQAIGSALTTEQQLFVSKNYAHLLVFANTADGRKAIQHFVEAWRASTAAISANSSSTAP